MSGPGVTLAFLGELQTIIKVALEESECIVMVMEERLIPELKDAPQLALFSVAVEHIPPEAEALLRCLNSFIVRGLFVKTAEGLRYVSPRRAQK
ncbi:MAG: hypothetical protein JXA21_26085 [Anaerolineae bacterium]|nr:hypothetical protein [Anaerolineae bacterium]